MYNQKLIKQERINGMYISLFELGYSTKRYYASWSKQKVTNIDIIEFMHYTKQGCKKDYKFLTHKQAEKRYDTLKQAIINKQIKFKSNSNENKIKH